MAYALGVICYGWHESAAVLVKDGAVVAAAEEERFSRRKFDSSFPKEAIAFCLAQAGIRPADLCAIGYGFDPRRQLPAKALHLIRHFPASLELITKRGPLLDRMNTIEQDFREKLAYGGPVYRLNHHLCHAASTFFSAPFERAAILTLDGAGDWESCWWGSGTGTQIRQIGTVNWPDSLGHIYAAFTEYLGFQPFSDEYKVMGLAPYGTARYVDKIEPIFYATETGYRLNFDYFDFQTGKVPRYSQKLVDTFGPPLDQTENTVPEHYRDIAASLQLHLERVIFHLVDLATQAADSRNLCLAGGVAMNSVANGKILSKGLVDALYVPPCASDAGVALGAAYLAHLRSTGQLQRQELRSALLGPAYGEAAIAAAIAKAGLSAERVDDPAQTAAELITAGNVVGWYQGRMEFGQRALGCRSILADPRRAEMKDIVNTKIKFRETFRPFAPSVLEEHVNEYFDCPSPSPFMTEVYPVLSEKQSVIPAVTHVDGTGRVQTVAKAVNPLYWHLIHHVYSLTGVPVVLNTSFNVKGQPIVNTPAEAIETYLQTEMDALVCGPFKLVKAV